MNESKVKDKFSGKAVSISEAAEILQCSEPWARIILQSPDRVDRSACGHPVYMYCRTRVELLAQERQCQKCEKRKDLGKRSCYLCQHRFKESELTSGICPSCQAYKWVRNFAHHGDCCTHCADMERVAVLENALKRFKHHLYSGKAKAI